MKDAPLIWPKTLALNLSYNLHRSGGRMLQDCLTNEVERRPSMKEVVERLTAIDAASKQPRSHALAATASGGAALARPALDAAWEAS